VKKPAFAAGFLRSGRGAAYDAIVAPRISVLVPCYDDGATVGEAVASIDEDEAVEVVLIDDGSRDPHTIAVLDELGARSGVRLIRQANSGVAAALRAGTAAATAPYVFVLNSDDLAEPRALAALADALDANRGADFAFGWIHFFGEVDFVARQPPWNPWILLHSNRWAISSLYRREALDAVGGVPEGTAYEDWDLLLGFAEQERRGVLVPRVVLHYRQHGITRRSRGAQGNLRRQYGLLRARHASLFARERELRRRYPLPLWTRLAYRLQLRAGLLLPPGVVPRILALKLRLRQIRGGGATGRAGTSGRARAPGGG
jgi:glycosyltransferase involved in cell wall biosynthesis